MSSENKSAASSAYVLPQAQAGMTTKMKFDAAATTTTTTWRDHGEALPKFLRQMLALNESKCNRRALVAFSCLGCFVPASCMAQMTKSLPLGAVFGAVMLLATLFWLAAPIGKRFLRSP